jgi:hypothetical protein
MTKTTRVIILTLATFNASFATAAPPPAASAIVAAARPPRPGYATVVRKVAGMTGDPHAGSLAARAGLELLNVLWEDTGRWQGSSVGPNISDVTIEVQMDNGRGQKQTALMPVLRHANFTDKTGDVALDKLMIPVGNQRPVSAPLSYVSLRDFLAAPGRYLTLPGKGTIKGGTLLARRDSHALVSAQATFLPVPREGKATFWPVIFNYQSSRQNPAVLTLLVTRQGTSATIVDNARDSIGVSSWGQRLFFNDGGQRAPLTGERLSEVQASGITMNGESAASLGADANLLMIVQVPLKYRAPRPVALAAPPKAMAKSEMASGAGAFANDDFETHRRSNVEVAVLGHGPELGPYTELDGLTIERDPRFPVRVTVQFYQATSNGVLAAADVRALRQQIKNVYAMADYVGSLVVPNAADRARPTNWAGVRPRPPGVTIQDFPGLMQRRREGLPLHPPGWDRGID